ncbi:hypothetical protein GGI11_008523 [Coemansia sp. RSA 2049]|nr:hypothetical protein GGI11_008523 [Coemansia sp. RSA 2049]
MQVASGAPAIPARRQSDADSNADASVPKYPPSIPPISSSPSRPESSVSGKKAPPRPTSRKPKILPKPAGLSGSRTSLHSSPTSSTGGIGDMRGHLKRTVQSPRDTNQSQYVNGRSSVDEDADESGVVQESQGSVSSLAGMFGQSIRSKTPGQSRPLAGVVAAASVPATPPLPPPPQQSSSALSNGSAHRRTSSGIAAPIQPPPPLPSFQTPPLSQPSFNRTNGAHPPQNAPMREGKWTFHNPSLFPPPPRGEIPQHKYPSGNRSGSSISFDM